MPWAKTSAMNERTKFVLEWERRWNAGQGRVDVAELCRIYGVSRPTGYRWIGRCRYLQAGHGLRVMADRSSRLYSSLTAAAQPPSPTITHACSCLAANP